MAETLLSTSAVALSGNTFRTATDPGPWDQLAFAPLTCLLYAASPVATTGGMPWTSEAAENVTKPTHWPARRPTQMSTEASWAAAAAWCADPLFKARVRGVQEMEPRQRDSVKFTVTKVLTAWLRTAARDARLPALDIAFLDDPHATVYLLTPADGTVAPQAITLMDQLINRQRVKVAHWEQFIRIAMILDEVANTPLPRLPQYPAESRGLGVSICFAAQAGEQLDAVYGPLVGRAIRAVVPAALIMYDSHEKELMESAAFWAGKTTRSHQTYAHNGDDKTTSRTLGDALEPAELMPLNDTQAQLVGRGTPGRMVNLLDFGDFVSYLDELRCARSICRHLGVVACQAAWVNRRCPGGVLILDDVGMRELNAPQADDLTSWSASAKQTSRAGNRQSQRIPGVGIGDPPDTYTVAGDAGIE